MSIHVLEVPVSDEELTTLETCARAAGLPSPAAYLRELFRREAGAATKENETALPAISDTPVSPDMTFAEILAPVHAQVAASGMTDDEVDEFLDQMLKKARVERRQQEQQEREQQVPAPETPDLAS